MSCADGEQEHAPRAKVINVFVISAATINTQVVKFASKSLSLTLLFFAALVVRAVY
jgi:hypothetical protein